MGYPIRVSADQFVFANPRSFSQLVTPFFASGSPGILRTPFVNFMPMRILSVFLSISSHTQFSKIIIKLLHCFNLFCLFFPSCQRTCRSYQCFNFSFIIKLCRRNFSFVVSMPIKCFSFIASLRRKNFSFVIYFGEGT